MRKRKRIEKDGTYGEDFSERNIGFDEAPLVDRKCGCTGVRRAAIGAVHGEQRYEDQEQEEEEEEEDEEEARF